MAHDCLVQLGPSKRRNLKDTIRPLLKDRKMEARESSPFAYCEYKKKMCSVVNYIIHTQIITGTGNFPVDSFTARQFPKNLLKLEN